jgi:hypothetical protein
MATALGRLVPEHVLELLDVVEEFFLALAVVIVGQQKIEAVGEGPLPSVEMSDSAREHPAYWSG